MNIRRVEITNIWWLEFAQPCGRWVFDSLILRLCTNIRYFQSWLRGWSASVARKWEIHWLEQYEGMNVHQGTPEHPSNNRNVHPPIHTHISVNVIIEYWKRYLLWSSPTMTDFFFLFIFPFSYSYYYTLSSIPLIPFNSNSEHYNILKWL